MLRLKRKFKENRGFTLVEMLVVVAIIAVLIAVSIPMVNASMETARHAVDDASFRNAAALANIILIQDGIDEAQNNSLSYYYVNESYQGTFGKGTSVPAGYNMYKSQCTCSGGYNGHRGGQAIMVRFEKPDIIKIEWVNK